LRRSTSPDQLCRAARVCVVQTENACANRREAFAAEGLAILELACPAHSVGNGARRDMIFFCRLQRGSVAGGCCQNVDPMLVPGAGCAALRIKVCIVSRVPRQPWTGCRRLPRCYARNGAAVLALEGGRFAVEGACPIRRRSPGASKRKGSIHGWHPINAADHCG
jgi:hypothetical protein